MIKIGNKEGTKLDSYIRAFTREDGEASQCPVILMECSSYLRPKEDDTLGLSDNNLIQWAEREDYTGVHLPHYLNYFMIHLLDGYLQTGEY